ncbi:DivIVA domain-containing protein [Actinophytocola sediminis]
MLTAHAVENARFDQARFPSRGYNEDQVDDFLDEVVRALNALDRTITDQRREIDRLKHWRQTTGTMERVTEGWEQEAKARAEAIVTAARVSADEIRRLAVTNPQQVTQHVVGPEHIEMVAGIVHRLHTLRDGISVELDRLEDALTPGR